MKRDRIADVLDAMAARLDAIDAHLTRPIPVTVQRDPAAYRAITGGWRNLAAHSARDGQQVIVEMTAWDAFASVVEAIGNG